MGLTEKECWFWLCTRPWLGIRSIEKLLGYFKTAKNIYYGRNSQYIQVPGVKEKLREKLLDPKEKDEEDLKEKYADLNSLEESLSVGLTENTRKSFVISMMRRPDCFIMDDCRIWENR